MPELGGALSAYGLPLGEAFQLRDDLLGVFGDDTVTGKPVGEDLREGKPTVLYALAAEAVGGPGTALDRYGGDDLTDDEIVALQEILVDTGAVELLETRIDAQVETAVAALEHASLSDEAVAALAELAFYVAGRDR